MAQTSPLPPLDDTFRQDPHSVYRLLRAEAPVSEVILPTGTRVWLVTRYDEAREALADPRLSKDARRSDEYWGRDDEGDGFDPTLQVHMLNSDPPDHTRLRRLVGKAFTTRRVAALRPRIEEITDALLADMAEAAARTGTGDPAQGADGATHGVVDLLDVFAFPLPITVICELLGVPVEDRDDFRRWSAAAVGDDVGVEASRQMGAYLHELIAAKRASGGDDLLAGLIEAREADDRLSEPELISMVFLLLVAGHETTVNLIGNGVLALLRNPDQLKLLRSDPSLLPGAVEEFLRYDSPVNLATYRFALEPLTLGGVQIPAGGFVVVSLLSANHDPERFADPGRLDITRHTAGHLAFGHGVHHCLGAPLARLEGEVALGRLFDRFPDLRPAGEPTELRWRASTLIRGLETLPVRLG